MKWWATEAKFGMFIHWGLVQQHACHEWVMENEAIPVSEYEKLAPNLAGSECGYSRAWAQLAKRAGIEVHGDDDQASREGFCNFDTKSLIIARAEAGTRVDLVREYVDVAR